MTTFPTASTLQHQCKACDTLVSRPDIKPHRKSQHHIDLCKQKGLYCHLCDKAFLDEGGFRAHNKSCHKLGIPAGERTPPSTSTRMDNNGGDTSSQARSGSASSGTQLNDLASSSANPPSPAQYPCQNCSQVFRKRKLRTQHKINCVSDSQPFQRGVPCTACEMRIRQKDVIDHKLSQEHINNSKLKGLYCYLCELSFMVVPGMYAHETTSVTHKANLRRSEPQSSEQAVEREVPVGMKYCGICKADYISATNEHQCTQTHLEAACKEKNLHCINCNCLFASDHLRQIHHCRRRPNCDPSRPSAFHCCDCNQSFPTNSQFIKHLKNGCVLKEGAFKCDPCNLAFSTRKQLNVHLNSKIHKTLKCLGSINCERKFKRLSDIIQHLESGACVSKFNRVTIDELVRSHDTAGAITIQDNPTPAKTLSGLNGTHSGGRPPTLNEQVDEDKDSDEGGVILTPETAFTPATVFTPTSTLSRCISTGTTPSGILTPTISESESQLANPKSCPICKRTFTSIGGLQMHIASPVHAVPIYHCPMDFLGGLGLENKNKKEREFRTLSGLTQHIEAGACSGGKKTWEKAIEFLQVKLAAFGLAGIKLLGQ